tara:strand:+ start:670 stop:1626 length:957 start_codon:yes stop_codon:yes gene_type:complete
MGLFDSIGKIVGNVGSGIADFVDTAGSFSSKLNPLSQIATGISGLFDNKDSGIQAPQISSSAPLGAFSPPPPPVATTTGLGTGSSNPFAMGFFAPNNQGSGGSLIPRPPAENQNAIIETNQSSLGNLVPFIPPALNLAGKALNFLRPQPFSPFGGSKLQNFKIPEIGQLLEDDDQTNFNLQTRKPMFEEFTQLVNPMMPQVQQAGAGFMSPVLGRIGISSKGNIIITRKLRNQFKALADNVGLAQASNLAGIPLEIGAMILTKRFPSKSKSISTKKMRDCANTYRQITNFYNMIPKRSATRTTKRATMRGASTVIQNS